MAPDEPTGPYLEAIRRAFRFAREQGRGCGPMEFLVGISEGDGPAAAALGGSLRAAAAGAQDRGAMYLHMQAQGAARSLAAARGQPAGPEHLLIALLDQDAPGVAQTLSRAGLDRAAVRRAALAAIGAPADLPAVPLPGLTPAGTMDRPPLPVGELDARAWTVLRWRQDHLPLGQLHRASDLQALTHLERSAAWRLADRLGVDDDQRYSLVHHHGDQANQLAARSRPDLVRPRRAPGRGHRRPRPVFGNVTAGWAAWLSNRRTGLRDRWFRLRTRPHYRGCPQP